MPTACVIYNPVKVDIDQLRAAVSAAEQAHGWAESLWLETTEDDPGVGMAEQAIAQEVDLVVACGGDGTVRQVIEGLSGSTIPLGLVPMGTGNLLARNLGLGVPEVAESVEVAFGGDDRTIDVALADYWCPDGSTDRQHFAVMAGVGIDAQMIVNTDDELKAKAGWLAYVKAVVDSLRSRQWVKMRLRIDNSRGYTTHAHTLIVANCGELVNSIALLPQARIDDGQLDLLAIRPKGPLGWVQITWKVVVEHTLLRRANVGRRAGNNRALRYQTGERFDVVLSRREPFELDGDVVGDVVAFTTRVLPASLNVRVPAHLTKAGSQ